MKMLFSALLVLSGCFDSLVSGTCAQGYVPCDGVCVAGTSCQAADAAPPLEDAAPPLEDAAPPPDAMLEPDAAATCPVTVTTCPSGCVDTGVDPANCGGCGVTCDNEQTCSNGTCCGAGALGCRGACIDPLSDPDNCGACGIACPSGICQQGACTGAPVGHLIVIGHDYVVTRTGMSRLLGNAVFLARTPQVAVATYASGAMPAGVNGATGAIEQVAREIGRSWRNVPVDSVSLPAALPSVDVLVVYAQDTVAVANLDALAAAWDDSLTAFLARGGIVVILEGGPGETHRVVGGRFATDGRAVATGTVLAVSAPGDAVAAAVPIAYFAEVDTVAFTGTTAPVVVVDTSGDPVVLHQTY
jgi:hypothetical protein